MNVIRKRIDKPLLSAIKIDNYEFDGLTLNNIIICDNIKDVDLILTTLKRMEVMKQPVDYVTLGLWEKELLEMTDDEFNKYLFEPEDWTNKLFSERKFDCVEIEFRNYAIQKFYVTMTPEIIYNTDNINDIWFIGGQGKAIALSSFDNEYKGLFYTHKSKMINMIRDGRFNL